MKLPRPTQITTINMISNLLKALRAVRQARSPTNAHLKSCFDLLGSFGVTFCAVRRAGFFIIVKMFVCCVVAFFCFMMFLGARKGLSFGALFRNLGALWYHFWVNFRSLEALWERWGPLSMAKSGLGPQRCPRRQNPENRVTL
jgi:hypothetical protein